MAPIISMSLVTSTSGLVGVTGGIGLFMALSTETKVTVGNGLIPSPEK